MNQQEIKNYAVHLNKLWTGGQFIEYARLIQELYSNYSTDIIMDVLDCLKQTQREESL